MIKKVNNDYRWRFFRSGGFDQVTLDTADDLRNLNRLDPKLWTVLNCPTTGLEFDARTAALLDKDADGQIRVPEILDAVQWSCERLVDPDILFRDEGLPVAAIADHDAEGAGIKEAALRVLQYLGKPADAALVVADLSDLTRLFSPDHFNGDGVVAPELSTDDSVRQLIAEIVDTQGGVADRSGTAGASAETLAAFFTQAQSVLAWHAEGAADNNLLSPLGSNTAAAVLAFENVRAKVDDYFMRCQLAAFDPRASESLNPAPLVYGALGNRTIATGDADVAALPLAAIVASKPLPLTAGINPAWSGAIQELRVAVIEPLLGPRDTLSVDGWMSVSQQLAAWRAWQAAKPSTAVHKLGIERLQAVEAGDGVAQVAALITEDLAAKVSASTIDAVEKLVRYQRDLVTLLHNFVSLSDFYRGQNKAIFQAGTLYLDQRSCELVMRVNDMGRHATMAPFSGCYLVYCNCERKGEAPMTIVAALTGGHVDELMVPGRNGIFYDRKGRDWRATITKVVEQPVSLRQAFWAPYNRVAAFIESQLHKFAASRDKDIEAKTMTGVGAVAAAPAATPATPAFDIAKFAGIFAAMGLAVGAIGTTLAAVVSGLFALSWWQIPLVLIGVLVVISGPSMMMAFLTLRRRNLGPLLDANGWAVNTRARINAPFGASLTGLATLPPGSTRSLVDPFADKKRPWKAWVFVGVLIVAVGVLWYRGMLAGLGG